MDAASWLGLGLGTAALLLAQHLEGGRLLAIAEPAAAVIVLGGTLAAALLGSSPRELGTALRLLPRAFRRPAERSRRTVARLVRLAGIARKEGLVALDLHAKRESDPALRAALEHVVEGANTPALRRQLETELEVRVERTLAAVRVWEAAGGAAPTMGILGAVLGLIHVMESLDEPSQLGSGIATAFVATLYGVGAANLLFLPLAAKLERRVEEERLGLELVIEGALAIQEGSSPSGVEDRLSAYLAAPWPPGGRSP